MAVSVKHAFVSPVVDQSSPGEVGPDEWNDEHTITGLGTAAEADSADFATAAQGALADSAVQPGDVDALVSANADVSANTAARHAAVTLTGEDYLSLTGQQITANAIDLDNLSATGTPSAATFLRGDNTWASPAGSGDMAAAVYDPQNISDDAFARANHTGTQAAATISDFDTEVANNTDVAANTAARHAAVTVTDSAEINFTLVGQDITASLIAASIDESKLDASVNASLDLADSAVQPAAIANMLETADIGVSVQAHDADLDSWAGVTRAAGFDTFVATPSSANLRALLTDEVGTGTAYFVGGALGTPASATLTNATGLPVAGITASTSTALGVGSIELGHATDTTLTRSSAGNLAVEGNVVYRAGGTDVPLADGGTGASLTDPNADRVMFWDDSAGAVTWLTMGTNLTITGTTLDAAGGSGQPVPTSSTFAVGTLLFVRNNAGGSISDGATIAGSSLQVAYGNSGGALVTGGGAQTGTWTNRSGRAITSSEFGMFARTA